MDSTADLAADSTGNSGCARGKTVSVRVRYFAGARAAAGVGEETLRVAPSTGPSVHAADVIDAVAAAHGDAVDRVLASSSFLINGVAARERAVEVPDGAEFDVLPPFAGG